MYCSSYGIEMDANLLGIGVLTVPFFCVLPSGTLLARPAW